LKSKFSQRLGFPLRNSRLSEMHASLVFKWKDNKIAIEMADSLTGGRVWPGIRKGEGRTVTSISRFL